MTFLFKKVVIVGVGLIGGSFALALKRADAVGQVVGVGRSPSVLARAAELGIIDRAATSPAEAVDGADLILIAAPVAQTGAILASLAPLLGGQTIVTDAGSTKNDVVAAARAALGARIAQFVPGHPIAGREANGPDAALPDLYQGKKTILTPLAENSAATVEHVATAWQACGAIVHRLSPEQHDRIFAAVSHLPHLLAYALVDQIDRAPESDQLFHYAASGFRDFTRIAGSSPEMWRDIALANREALLVELATYGTQLEKLQTMLAAGDAAGLEALFGNAQRARHAWLKTIEAAERPNRNGGD
ncbi:MAG: prephenate dehydrogenase/arogenate dehydrogenase family protein [Herminiimonas sp.]|nr:prephenate dehydrogenase/arogenate dehydrogenase family protein [Herminiimonas sp.]